MNSISKLQSLRGTTLLKCEHFFWLIKTTNKKIRTDSKFLMIYAHEFTEKVPQKLAKSCE